MARAPTRTAQPAPAAPPPTGAAERSLRLLALLAREGRPLTLAELTARLALPKVTVHRLCAHLQAAGHLVRDLDERALTLGPAVRALALDTLNHATDRGLRHGVLQALVADLGETCNFTTLDGTEALYLDRVEAPRPLRLTIDVGARVPLHCTASGKLLLAHMAPESRDRVIARLPLARLTERTITRPAALREECKRIVERGCSVDDEEFVAGLIAVAVPVRDAGGAVRATVSVHAPAARLSLKQALARIDRLRDAAVQMGRLI